MRHNSGRARTVGRVAAVVAVAVLMSGCSSSEPAQAEEWQQDYCSKLGAWQDARRAVAADDADVDTGGGLNVRSPESEDIASAGQEVIDASKRLARHGLEHGGTYILDDTANAVGGDVGAEYRAVSYCDSSGFETLVGSAGQILLRTRRPAVGRPNSPGAMPAPQG
ncbi:hypothetical protein ABZ883_11785 [Streptomyces sp. NPDC046977]|uniref:hypothetical protein n=1 Tax=Streptomyces sp. NPDC046977 TaxID=3154703 RepID=UPI0034035BEB